MLTVDFSDPLHCHQRVTFWPLKTVFLISAFSLPSRESSLYDSPDNCLLNEFRLQTWLSSSSFFFFFEEKFLLQTAIKTQSNFKGVLSFTNHCDAYDDRSNKTVTASVLILRTLTNNGQVPYRPVFKQWPFLKQKFVKKKILKPCYGFEENHKNKI